MNTYHSRRDFFRKAAGTAAATGILATPGTIAAPPQPGKDPFRYCLNMSTIRGQKLGIEKEVDVAGMAGYDGIEPWFRTINAYKESGGKLKDLRKRIKDHGLKVFSAIGFAKWIVDDDNQRKAGLEEAKRDMDTIAQLGGTHIAAPPAGAPWKEAIDPLRVAERYRALLKLGDKMDVIPQIEMWGGNGTIGRVSTAIYIAIEADHPKACFLGDAYHTYKGGSGFDGIKLLSANALHCYHMNDYPADPPRETIRDEHRVYPGDGIAPLTRLFRNFLAVGASPALSLEVFNREYWKQDALKVAKTGLAKMKAEAAKALA
ncbi:MAG: sugar phosphate isomerase/epimerase [Opitutae bacterium]|nr:sugar phosphate isomerase/epimerase [Opitutae bacterium]MBT7854162.1 sugar phosphate isomerase/epimerase [Opitutae bacterium]